MKKWDTIATPTYRSKGDSGYRRRRWAMVNLMKAKRIMRNTRANRVHLEEVAAVNTRILLYIIIQSMHSRNLFEVRAPYHFSPP